MFQNRTEEIIDEDESTNNGDVDNVDNWFDNKIIHPDITDESQTKILDEGVTDSGAIADNPETVNVRNSILHKPNR